MPVNELKGDSMINTGLSSEKETLATLVRRDFFIGRPRGANPPPPTKRGLNFLFSIRFHRKAAALDIGALPVQRDLRPRTGNSGSAPVNFFICLITLPANLKNWDFKKGSILPATVGKMFVFVVLKDHWKKLRL